MQPVRLLISVHHFKIQIWTLTGNHRASFDWAIVLKSLYYRESSTMEITINNATNTARQLPYADSNLPRQNPKTFENQAAVEIRSRRRWNLSIATTNCALLFHSLHLYSRALCTADSVCNSQCTLPPRCCNHSTKT